MLQLATPQQVTEGSPEEARGLRWASPFRFGAGILALLCSEFGCTLGFLYYGLGLLHKALKCCKPAGKAAGDGQVGTTTTAGLQGSTAGPAEQLPSTMAWE